jgi:hypothetical protein
LTKSSQPAAWSLSSATASGCLWLGSSGPWAYDSHDAHELTALELLGPRLAATVVAALATHLCRPGRRPDCEPHCHRCHCRRCHCHSDCGICRSGVGSRSRPRSAARHSSAAESAEGQLREGEGHGFSSRFVHRGSARGSPREPREGAGVQQGVGRALLPVPSWPGWAGWPSWRISAAGVGSRTRGQVDGWAGGPVGGWAGVTFQTCPG